METPGSKPHSNDIQSRPASVAIPFLRWNKASRTACWASPHNGEGLGPAAKINSGASPSLQQPSLAEHFDSPDGPSRDLIFAAAALAASVSHTKIPCAKNRTFATRYEADSTVKTSAQKYFASFFQKHMIVCRRPVLMKRGVRVVTNVERGMRWTCWCRQTSDVVADGEVVWSWPPDAEAKFVRLRSARATGARKPGPRGEHEGHR